MSIRAAASQKGNLLLAHIPRARVVYTTTPYDYEPGAFFGVLYLSLKVHLQSPSYIYKRIEEIKGLKDGKKTVLLLYVDTDPSIPVVSGKLSALQIDCFGFSIQTLLSSGPQESAKYLTCLDDHATAMPETRPAHIWKSLRQHRRDLSKRDALPRPETPQYPEKSLFLTTIPKLKVDDAEKLLSTGQSLREIVVQASEHALQYKGFGGAKKEAFFAHLFKAFNQA
ncbi:DNA excision repair protein ERCC-1 [Nematocida displodere]|uniref:DNA excision repair protein ERCC-1 n=1 Tax=Nematocida displodere TaxID=1805483 RepID=A0A177EII1_9MICR|nr:DNA excision repair protein ERCC-1 [Nematocida displodere]